MNIKKKIYTSNDLVSYLINEIGLVTLSGTCFGYHKGLTLRYSFVDIINPEKEISFYDKIVNIKKALDQLEIIIIIINYSL